ncbi:MAG: hypothetical protein ACYC21_02185 [Eubacteriales bacterium]
MGDLRNCPVCGKVFVKLNRNLCPECMDKEEFEYEEARKYLKDNPGASIEEISELTGIDEKKIMRWVREGRIDVNYDGVSPGVTCKRCGASISLGNLCSNCIRLLSGQMKSAATSSKPAAGAEPDKDKDSKTKGMFVADRLRKE